MLVPPIGEGRRVFLPNLPTNYNAEHRRRQTRLDLTPAEAFGELIVLTEGPVDTRDLPELLDAAALAAHVYMRRTDLILCAGDYLLTATFIAGAIRTFGCAGLLRWDRRAKRYDIITTPTEEIMV